MAIPLGNYTLQLHYVSKNDPAKFNLNAKNFITLFPSSPSTPQLKDLLNKNIFSEFYSYINKKDYYNVVSFYQKNKNVIDSHPKRIFLLHRLHMPFLCLGIPKTLLQ